MSDAPALFGKNLFGDPADPFSGALAIRFTMPPFSVLNARAGDWQARKQAWIRLGIQSELGRGNVQSSFESVRRLQKTGQSAAPGRSPLPAANYGENRARGDSTGKPIGPFSKDSENYSTTEKGRNPAVAIPTHPDGYRNLEKAKKSKANAIHCDYQHGSKAEEAEDGKVENWAVSSIFDPVLCELAYKWWCPPGGQVLDPFAGGSVRGIVAGALGYDYWGGELRPEQVEANRAQAETIKTARKPVWVCGDSRVTVPTAPDADFILSCPPYGNLEIYSEDKDDISNMTWPQFAAAYKEIIRKACDRLREDRFVCWVVGEFRDPATGHYRNFVGGTIKAFKQCGLGLYNEAILVTAVGSASVRAGRQFDAGRKLVKTHQNILTFIKGDWRRASQAVTGRGVTEEDD